MKLFFNDLIKSYSDLLVKRINNERIFRNQYLILVIAKVRLNINYIHLNKTVPDRSNIQKFPVDNNDNTNKQQQARLAEIT